MAERVRGVALCFNHEPGVSDAAARLAGLFLGAGVTVGVDGEYTGDPRFDGCAAGYDGCDALITLGGDGTLLRGCRDAVSRGIPVCGINLGHMGFLTSLEAGEAAECVRRLCDGDYTIERRMTVQADAPGAPLALNDCTITRADTSKRILSLEISVDGDQASAFSGDGLVIATPTGSTSYSLAAGGPIVRPDVELMLLTPVSPHALSARPMIVPASSRVTVRVVRASEGRLAMDGLTVGSMSEGESVTVCRGRRDVELIRFARTDFYTRLRSKLTGLSQ